MKRLIKMNSKSRKLKYMIYLLYNLKSRKKNATVDIKKMYNALSDQTESNNNARLEDLKKEIKKEDPDCIYNGFGYRKLSFDIEEFNIEDLAKNNTVEKRELIRHIKNIIATGFSQSFSDTLEACEDFCPSESDDNTFEVIIKAKLNDGINVHMLLDKYTEILQKLVEQCENEEYDGDLDEDDIYRYFNRMDDLNTSFQKEKEIISELPNNYEIIKINDIDITSSEEILDWDLLFPNYPLNED